MKYQIQSITLATGNPVFLAYPFEMSADNINDLGARVADALGQLGLDVHGVGAIYRGDIEEAWQREPEKPNLFNGGGEELPKQRKRRRSTIDEKTGIVR